MKEHEKLMKDLATAAEKAAENIVNPEKVWSDVGKGVAAMVKEMNRGGIAQDAAVEIAKIFVAGTFGNRR